MSGANTYTGATTINSGTLRVIGSLAASSAVNVGGTSASGSPTLAGSGTINGSVTVAGSGSGAAGHIAPSGYLGSASPGQTLNLAGSLTLNTGSDLDFNLSSSPTGTNDLISMTGSGAVNYGTGGVLNINAYSGSLGIGTYTLISDPSGTPTSGTGWTVGTNNDANAASHISLVQVVGNNLDLVVTSNNVYWTGAATSWDTTNTNSWVTSNGAPVPFGNGYAAVFGDTYPNGSGNSAVGNSGGIVSVTVQTAGIAPTP